MVGAGGLLGLGMLLVSVLQDGVDAGEAMARAEALACRGRVRDAQRLYRRLAEDLAGFYAYRMGLRATGLRLPLVFGPGLWYEGVAAQIGRLFEAAVSGEALSMEVPDAAVDMMYVKDAASAFLHLARHDGPLDYVYNVKAFAPTFAELADMVRKLTRDFPVDFTEVPPPHKYPTMSGDRLRAIGFHPAFSLREACADYLAELRAFDEVVVCMHLAGLAQNRMTLGFAYRRIDAEAETLIARGEQVVACMRREGERLVPTPIPETLREALRLYDPVMAVP